MGENVSKDARISFICKTPGISLLCNNRPLESFHKILILLAIIKSMANRYSEADAMQYQRKEIKSHTIKSYFLAHTKGIVEMTPSGKIAF